MGQLKHVFAMVVVAVGAVGCVVDQPVDDVGKSEQAIGAGSVATACAPGYVLTDGACMDESTYCFIKGCGGSDPMPMPELGPEIIVEGGGGGSVLLMPPAESVSEELKKSVKDCFDKVDYNTLGHSYKAAGERYTHRSGSTFWSVGSYLGSAVVWLVETSDQARAWTERIAFGGSEADNYLDSLTTEMSSKFSSGGFKNYQKACLAQCIASRIIKYQANTLSKIGGASEAVAQGVGVCTEFSAIAARLINGSAGSSVSASTGLSPGHAFVQVTFDGNTYGIEPQVDPSGEGSCVFYQ